MRRDMSKAFSLCPWILLAVQRVEGRGRGARLNEGSLAVTLDDARAHRATRSLVNPGPKHTSSVVVNTPCTDTVALARLFSVPRMDTHVQVQVVPASHHALSRDPRHAKVYRCWRLAGSSEGSAGSTEKASCFTIHSNGQPAAATAAADEGYLVPALSIVSIVSTSRTPIPVHAVPASAPFLPLHPWGRISWISSTRISRPYVSPLHAPPRPRACQSCAEGARASGRSDRPSVHQDQGTAEHLAHNSALACLASDARAHRYAQTKPVYPLGTCHTRTPPLTLH